MEVKRSAWGSIEGHPAEKFTIKDPKTNFTVELLDFGATLVRVMTPDRDGKLADINFGHNNAESYKKVGSFFGAVAGRVANRIAIGKFTLEGKEYTLFVNNANKHSMHGGKEGFNNKWWTVTKAASNEKEAMVQFKYISKDGEEGYPGTLTIFCTYHITPTSLGWEFEAETDKTTIVNVTNHAYWNLDDIGSLVDDLEIQLEADQYMPADKDGLATGEVKSLESAGIDLKKPRTFADVFKIFGDMDHNFILNNFKKKASPKEVAFAGKLRSPKNGRTMMVFTTEPCIQVYTGNSMEGLVSFGKTVHKHSAVCLEAQKAPNAINFPKFRDSVILRPKEKYYHKTVHEFSIE